MVSEKSFTLLVAYDTILFFVVVPLISVGYDNKYILFSATFIFEL